MKIGDRVFVRGYIDEIHKDTVIIRNAGGYFGTIPSEVITGELPSAQPEFAKDKNVPSNDCVSRQAAIDALGYCQTYLFDSRDKDKKISLEDAEYAIEQLPSAQPEPQEGHWIRTDCGLDVECKCSVCGYKDFVEPHDTYWFKRNYCPNCGAKMGGATT